MPHIQGMFVKGLGTVLPLLSAWSNLIIGLVLTHKYFSHNVGSVSLISSRDFIVAFFENIFCFLILLELIA